MVEPDKKSSENNKNNNIPLRAKKTFINEMDNKNLPNNQRIKYLLNIWEDREVNVLFNKNNNLSEIEKNYNVLNLILKINKLKNIMIY